MIVAYNIEEKDLLTQLLFGASKSEQVKKTRRKGKIAIFVFYLLFAIFLFATTQRLMATSFLLVGLVMFFLYPVFERKRYIKHYTTYIREIYKNRLDKHVRIQIEDDVMLLTDEGNESRVQNTEIEHITEIGTSIIIRIKSGQSMLIPKDRIEDPDALRTRLLVLAEHQGINYNTDLNWKWR